MIHRIQIHPVEGSACQSRLDDRLDAIDDRAVEKLCNGLAAGEKADGFKPQHRPDDNLRH